MLKQKWSKHWDFWWQSISGEGCILRFYSIQKSTANLPPKIGRNCPPKERIVSQSSIFRVKMLGSGRVYVFCLFGNFSGFMCCFMLKSKFWSGFEIMPWRLQIFLKHWTIISDFFFGTGEKRQVVFYVFSIKTWYFPPISMKVKV